MFNIFGSGYRKILWLYKGSESKIYSLIISRKCDIIKYLNSEKEADDMAVSYKPLLHMMIERDISNAELMRRASISANIITKIKNGQYIALDKVESICSAMNCTPNDMMEFIPDHPKEEEDHD